MKTFLPLFILLALCHIALCEQSLTKSLQTTEVIGKKFGDGTGKSIFEVCVDTSECSYPFVCNRHWEADKDFTCNYKSCPVGNECTNEQVCNVNRICIAAPCAETSDCPKNFKCKEVGGTDADGDVITGKGCVPNFNSSPPESPSPSSPAPSPSSSPDPTDDDSSTDSKSKLPLIIGIVVGVVVLIAIIGAVIYFMRKKKKPVAGKSTPNEQPGITESFYE